VIRAMGEARDAYGINTAVEKYSWEMGAVWMMQFLTGKYPGVEFFRAKLKSMPKVYPDQIRDLGKMIDEGYKNTVLDEILRPAEHDDSLQPEICKHCIYSQTIRPDCSPLRPNHIWCKKQKCEVESHLKCKIGRWGYFI
ncbi:MAG: hypothetical protein U9P14_08095, partial [Gemmatimonadota bacterium]|nr:hypothetical protein [Gemmatimonadota bacterium]